MASHESHRTHDHDIIQQWAEQRDGRPARVKGTANYDDPGIIRIDFPGYSGEEDLEEISWDDFFRKFEEKQLALVCQEGTEAGQTSHFSKLIER
jgi:hypothetical protein